MGHLFLDILLLSHAQSQRLHLLVQLLPIFLFLLLLIDHFGVSLLDEVFGRLHLFFGVLRNYDLFGFFSHLNKYSIIYASLNIYNNHFHFPQPPLSLSSTASSPRRCIVLLFHTGRQNNEALFLE